MNIYLASSWRNPVQQEVVKVLRDQGHAVYDFKNPAPALTGFSWKAIDQDWQKWTPARWRTALRHDIANLGFANDKNALDWCDCGVLVLPCGRSAHLEAGYLAGRGKMVFTLALEDVEPELMQLLLGPSEAICVTIKELASLTEAWAATLASRVAPVRP